MTDLDTTVHVTLPVRVKTRGLFLSMEGASITEGEYAGSHFVTNAVGGQPILYVKKAGAEDQTCWIPLQDLIEGLIKAFETAIADEPAAPDNPA